MEPRFGDQSRELVGKGFKGLYGGFVVMGCSPRVSILWGAVLESLSLEFET